MGRNKQLSAKPSKATTSSRMPSLRAVVSPGRALKAPKLQTVPAIKVLPRELRVRRERARFCALLGQDTDLDEMAVVKLVSERLPVNVIDKFIAEGITQQEIDRLIAPRRTQTHRRANSEPMTVDESDRAVRIARVVAKAESVFDNKQKSLHWLHQPMKRFEGRSPLDMLDTDVGSRLVEEALVRIDEGFFA